MSIYLKELRGYFATITGYLVIALFLLVSGLFLFVFDSEYNLLNYGFADLQPFFILVPWLFILLIPAITMSSFATERSLGTLEMVMTRPITIRSIVAGKYLAVLTLMLVSIIPTFIYVYTIGDLGDTPFNLDMGSTIGSYIGLLLVVGCYTAIGICCSILTSNQIVAFLLAALLCFIMYYGFEGFADVVNYDQLATLGIKYHYQSIARGVIDTRDVIYFISVAVFFFALSEIKLKQITQNQ